MGVSGAGKTVTGRALAARLGATFLDADELHSPANVAKMAAGEALTDEDRWPWLDAVGRELAASTSIVIACSALKRAYRDRLRLAAPDVFFACLSAPEAELARRIRARRSHYMPASLLQSQLEALEPLAAGECGVTVDTSNGVDASVSAILDATARGGSARSPQV